jgi:hypothetical protein
MTDDQQSKNKVIVVWNPQGFHVVKVLPKGCKWTIQYYIENLLPEICAFRVAGDRRRLVVHADNARPHVSRKVKEYLEGQSLRTAPHPPYSPDLAPSDFFLFGYVKRMLQGSEFQATEELLEAVVTILNAIPDETLTGTFHEWMKRLQTCIDTGGEYVE